MATTLFNYRNSGWIKIHRKFLEWEWYSDIKTSRLFLHLILTANYETKGWKGIDIPRGSLVTSRAQLAQQTNLSEQEVKTCLKHLKSTNEITIKSTNKYTLITICNFECYQTDDTENNQHTNQQNNQQSTNKQPTNNQQVTTTKEIKNINNTFPYGKGSETKVSLSPENGKKEKVTKEIKKKGKKKDGKATLVARARDVFEKYYLEQYETPYYWSAKDGMNMKQLLQKISYSRKHREKPLAIDDDSLLEAFEKFIKKINKGWIMDNFSIPNINSQYNNIISEIKNQNKISNVRTNSQTESGRQGFGPYGTDSSRQRAAVLADIEEADRRFLEKRQSICDVSYEEVQAIPNDGSI